MNCHDGNIMQFQENVGAAGGQYFFYCMAYGAGWPGDISGIDHNVSLYTSSDLTSGSWEYRADILPMRIRPMGTYYRPKVVYNPATRRYVLWVNWMPPGDFKKSQYLTATATSPVGPFTVEELNATTKFIDGGDFCLFVDDDPPNTGYVVYTSLAAGHSISIAPLTHDFLNSIPENNTGFLPGTTGGCYEAPVMFKREGVYWVFLGPCCCACQAGSDTYVYQASSPLGPYTFVGSLGNAEHAQQNYVFQVPTSSGIEFIWTGDRWHSSPDGNGQHDFQFWQPLKFSKVVTSATRIVKCKSCIPSDPVYMVDNIGVLHSLTSCIMCGRNWCDLIEDVSPSFLDGRKKGVEFKCPISQLESPEELPSFTLDLNQAQQAVVV